MDSKVITVDELAQALRISRYSAYKSVKTGEIPSIKIGKRLLIPVVQLNKLLEGNKQN